MTATNSRHLRAVPTPHAEPGASGYSVVCQAKLTGPQTVSVSALAPVTRTRGCTHRSPRGRNPPAGG